MNLIFELGDRDMPVGHALVYWRGTGDEILATYVNVLPIKFNFSQYVPGFMASAVQESGLGLSDAMNATAIPPIPEKVEGLSYLHGMAARRKDDLVFAGGAMQGDPMRLAAETAEAARQYGELYQAVIDFEPVVAAGGSVGDDDDNRYADMSEQDRLNELTALTGRLRDSLAVGTPDLDVERQMDQLAQFLPAKYRAAELIRAAHLPGSAGQTLAQLYLERCFKLFHEEYLDLERIDREIAAASE